MQIFGLTTSDAPLAVQTHHHAEVRGVLERAAAAAREGRWSVFVVAYDAAPAFEPAMRVAGPPTAFPLAWLSEFESLTPVAPVTASAPGSNAQWPRFVPQVEEDEFCARVLRAQTHIRNGDTYQVNLTFPMSAVAPAEPLQWFQELRAAQPAPYAAFLDLGRHVVLSLSPELFFETVADRGVAPADTGVTTHASAWRIRTRPMKGTARRGRWLAEDETLAATLAASRKTQAENVMIVDLLRNDVGRVAATGSVHVPRLFDVERYPTLWQMTSTVEGTLREGTALPDIFDALFPCGSVTGAPKIRTMDIIRELEGLPRGMYTGAIGVLAPDGTCTCSVAIRTIVIDRESGAATLNVGAGITADSVPEDEYAECVLKGAFATPATGDQSPFRLLETIRLQDGVLVRLDRHLQRMRDSARYFGFTWDEMRVRECLDAEARRHSAGTWRVRLTADRDGEPAVTVSAHADIAGGRWRVAFANAAVDPANPFLFNKTTRRDVYESARRARPDVDDVLLWNPTRELTESTIANVVVEIDGERCTPPVTCGLLGGVLRAELLDRGEIRERVITRGEVMRAERLWLVNSLRGWIEAEVVR